MRQITININPSIYEHIMFLLVPIRPRWERIRE